MNTTETAKYTEKAASTMTEQRMWDFVAAWSRKDIDALMTYISEDCVYVTTTGPDPGTTYNGTEEVRAGFLSMLSDEDDTSKEEYGPLFLCEDRGVLEWSSTYTDDTGSSVFIRGCDLFAFQGNLICRKDAFRKVLP